MAPTVINVQGKAKLYRVAERAKLDIEISSSEYEQSTASANVVTTVSSLQNQLDEICTRADNGEISPSAPVSFYSIGSLTTSSDDEYDEDHNKTGKRLYKATSSVDIRFRDFAKLGEMVVAFSTVPFVSLQGIEWKLTEEKQAALEEQAKLDALRHAFKRATGYADVIGRRNVTPVKIDDTHYMFAEGRVMQTARKVSSNASYGIGVGLDFEPQQVEVNATLEVEFHAE
ncbi:uncharacterized protein A1O9_06440 [Exophiala aquamarina CBS 119918]|uniref:DUF541 domain-containing protein n=1 Tax=Exophiala aquamarina CBS 119918 TaxID=1182545 RepID=A0A072PEI2_9EURO|nr:uncharacterized protein A1O9_06440 [Exophiala aquamarina CBS 119918]KEF58514.1 hypothetical protein A1O9_06440 [Exophiala aquamarina CBS 119918]